MLNKIIYPFLLFFIYFHYGYAQSDTIHAQNDTISVKIIWIDEFSFNLNITNNSERVICVTSAMEYKDFKRKERFLNSYFDDQGSYSLLNIKGVNYKSFHSDDFMIKQLYSICVLPYQEMNLKLHVDEKYPENTFSLQYAVLNNYNHNRFQSRMKKKKIAWKNKYTWKQLNVEF